MAPPFELQVDREKDPNVYDLLHKDRKEPTAEEPVETPGSKFQ